MNALELLQSTPAEQLHHNLRYIDRNKGMDFVAEALRPEGRSIRQTVKSLYAKEENYSPAKVKEIADFVNGFDGLEKITDDQLGNLDFKDVEAARLRHEKGNNTLSRFLVYGFIGSLGGGYLAGAAQINNGYANVMLSAVFVFATFFIGIPSLFTSKLNKKIEGNQEPRYAYNSLLRKSAQADEFLQIYSIAEKLNYRDEQR